MNKQFSLIEGPTGKWIVEDQHGAEYFEGWNKRAARCAQKALRHVPEFSAVDGSTFNPPYSAALRRIERAIRPTFSAFPSIEIPKWLGPDWRDISWGNDAAARLQFRDTDYCLWVDEEDQTRREISAADRFMLLREIDGLEPEVIFSTSIESTARQSIAVFLREFALECARVA